eukprot:7275775-Prorocentrum_lima.AAC.1
MDPLGEEVRLAALRPLLLLLLLQASLVLQHGLAAREEVVRTGVLLHAVEDVAHDRDEEVEHHDHDEGLEDDEEQ